MFKCPWLYNKSKTMIKNLTIKLYLCKLRLYSLGFTPVNLVLILALLRLLYLILVYFFEYNINLEFIDSIYSNLALKKVEFNIELYHNLTTNYYFSMHTYLIATPYDNPGFFLEKNPQPMFPGVYLMENTRGESSNSSSTFNDLSQDQSNSGNVDESSYYPKKYTFTVDEFRKFQSLDNDKLIREFDPRFLRKFSETLIDEDFYKHLNSPTNHKFHNSLGNNIKTRLYITLACHDNNYEEAVNDMNKTLNDPKGRV